MQSTIKSGYKTTEFGLTIIAWVVAIAVALGWLPEGQASEWIELGTQLVAAITTAAYILSRLILKVEDVRAVRYTQQRP